MPVSPIPCCVFATATFDLWMSKGAYDIFALVNFLNADWVPTHVTFGLFKACDTSEAAMAVQLQHLLDKYNLRNWILYYIKDEGSNLATITNALKMWSVVKHCRWLSLLKALVSGMQYPKHVNMLQPMIRWAAE